MRRAHPAVRYDPGEPPPRQRAAHQPPARHPLTAPRTAASADAPPPAPPRAALQRADAAAAHVPQPLPDLRLPAWGPLHLVKPLNRRLRPRRAPSPRPSLPRQTPPDTPPLAPDPPSRHYQTPGRLLALPGLPIPQPLGRPCCPLPRLRRPPRHARRPPQRRLRHGRRGPPARLQDRALPPVVPGADEGQPFGRVRRERLFQFDEFDRGRRARRARAGDVLPGVRPLLRGFGPVDHEPREAPARIPCRSHRLLRCPQRRCAPRPPRPASPPHALPLSRPEPHGPSPPASPFIIGIFGFGWLVFLIEHLFGGDQEKFHHQSASICAPPGRNHTPLSLRLPSAPQTNRPAPPSVASTPPDPPASSAPADAALPPRLSAQTSLSCPPPPSATATSRPPSSPRACSPSSSPSSPRCTPTPAPTHAPRTLHTHPAPTPTPAPPTHAGEHGLSLRRPLLQAHRRADLLPPARLPLRPLPQGHLHRVRERHRQPPHLQDVRVLRSFTHSFLRSPLFTLIRSSRGDRAARARARRRREARRDALRSAPWTPRYNLPYNESSDRVTSGVGIMSDMPGCVDAVRGGKVKAFVSHQARAARRVGAGGRGGPAPRACSFAPPGCVLAAPSPAAASAPAPKPPWRPPPSRAPAAPPQYQQQWIAYSFLNDKSLCAGGPRSPPPPSRSPLSTPSHPHPCARLPPPPSLSRYISPPIRGNPLSFVFPSGSPLKQLVDQARARAAVFQAFSDVSRLIASIRSVRGRRLTPSLRGRTAGGDRAHHPHDVGRREAGDYRAVVPYWAGRERPLPPRPRPRPCPCRAKPSRAEPS